LKSSPRSEGRPHNLGVKQSLSGRQKHSLHFRSKKVPITLAKISLLADRVEERGGTNEPETPAT
jgi:hypothetical protein